MFTLQRQANGRWRNRSVLRVERLEGRDCPAGPVLSSFSATVLDGRNVQLAGRVDTDHGGVVVNFSGVAGGSTAVQTNGSFSLNTTASALGTISAIATDNTLWSNSLSSQITSATPSVTVNVAQNGGRNVRVSGQVTDDSFSGEVVVLTG